MPPTIARYCTLALTTVLIFSAVKSAVKTGGVPVVAADGHSAMSTVARKRRAYNLPVSKLDEASRLLAELTNAEKAQLLKWVVLDLSETFPGIESDSDVSGGEPCIVRTRIPVWVLEQARRLGVSEADILRSYPSLKAEDLANAWAYVRSHREEIDNQIRDNEAA
jgi:uncharacterized protein (DUF433 family)